MKITITGSLGNTGKPLTEKLAQAGHDVTVVTSSDDRKDAIEALGAKAAIGTVDDEAFLASAFAGADVVYTMVPPNFGAADMRAFIADTGKFYAKALKQAGVKSVVNLSSIGADIDGGTGPISGLHDVEETLNGLDGVAVKHLRAGFFYINYLGNIDMIKNMNLIGSNYGPDTTIILVHPVDIATAAAELIQKGFTGKSVQYVASDQRNSADVARVLGTSVGKPDLKWVEFSDQQALEGMEKAGMPAPIAQAYTEMGAAVRNGILFNDFKKVNPGISGIVKLEDFAVEFAGKY